MHNCWVACKPKTTGVPNQKPRIYDKFYNQCVVAIAWRRFVHDGITRAVLSTFCFVMKYHRYNDKFSIPKMFNYSKQTRHRLVKSNLAQLFTICSFNPLVIHFWLCIPTILINCRKRMNEIEWKFIAIKILRIKEISTTLCLKWKKNQE